MFNLKYYVPSVSSLLNNFRAVRYMDDETNVLYMYQIQADDSFEDATFGLQAADGETS